MKIAADNRKQETIGFASNILQKNALVYDLRAVVNGEPRYFIIKVAPAKQAAFLRAIEKDAELRLEDYGDILYRGWDEPEDDLKEQLSRDYGMRYPQAPAGSQTQ